MHYFIVNPNANAGLGEKTWLSLKKILDENKIEYKYSLTSLDLDAATIAKEISLSLKSPISIAVIGGDGTLNEVINGLTNLELITLGVVPVGSGNDFVRSFGYKTTAKNYLNKILSPNKIIEYNIGKLKNHIGQRKFIVSSGIGFDASVTYTVNNSNFRKIFKNTPISKLVYIFSAIKMIILYKPLKFKVSIDDSVKYFNSGFFCIIMNTPYEGKAVKFCPDAKGYDDIFDFCMINTKHKLKVVYLILRGYFGKHITNKDVYISKGHKFRVETSETTHCHTDGEQLGLSDWAEFSLLDEKIKIIVD